MFTRIGMFEINIDKSMSDDEVIAYLEKKSLTKPAGNLFFDPVMAAVIEVTVAWLKARIEDHFRRKNEQDPSYTYRRLFDYNRYDPNTEQEPALLGIGYTLEEESEQMETIENERRGSWSSGSGRRATTCWGTLFDRVTTERRRGVKALWVKALQINRGSNIGQEVWLKTGIFGEDTWGEWYEITRIHDHHVEQCNDNDPPERPITDSGCKTSEGVAESGTIKP